MCWMLHRGRLRRSHCRQLYADLPPGSRSFFFFFNDPATTEIYPLSLPDALPISPRAWPRLRAPSAPAARWAGCPVPRPGPGSRWWRLPPRARGPRADRAPTARRAAWRGARGRGGPASSPDGSDDHDRVFPAEVVRHLALRQVVRDPALPVHHEHVLVRAGGEDEGAAPHAAVVRLLERDRAGPPGGIGRAHV